MSVLQTQQILVPKKVYIGDRAELQCTFSSSQDLFSTLSESGNQLHQLPLSSFSGNLNFKDYDIQKVEISQIGINYYQVKVTFVPWKTGKLQFPSYNLATALNPGSTEKIFIKFEPQNIVSITEQNNTYALRSATKPILLPGTTYKLYGFLVAVLILLIAVIRAIIKHKEIAFFIQTRKLLRKYRKNKRKTLKKFKRLSKQEIDDKTFASEIQSILRSYLEVRYEYPFTKTVTSQIMNKILEVTGGLLSDKKTDAAGEIVSAFVRTDYIRYAQGSIGSEQAKFLENEKTELLDKLKKNIIILETIEKPAREDSKKEDFMESSVVTKEEIPAENQTENKEE